MSEITSRRKTVDSQESPSQTDARWQSIFLLELSLLLFVWFVFGIAINSSNLEAFNLQQAGVEAMVERRQFSVEGSPTPQFQIKVYYYDDGRPFGDTFMYKGRQFAAKQPGQFMLGAVIYFFLRLFGLSYLHNFTLTSALVSFLTTSLVAALATVTVFRIVREFTRAESLVWPLISALIYAFGTTTFAYSGFAYHDSLASGYLIVAFYLVLLLARRRVDPGRELHIAGAVGFLLGFTITTSMLPFFMTCVVFVYLVSLRRWKLTAAAMAGGLVGVLPLFIYNAMSFGSPFLNSYMAGGYPESFLHFNLQNSLEKIRFYTSEITFYNPVAWLGALGLVFYPRELRRERLVIVGIFIAHAFQVLNIESHGGCHYGPRFLLPVLPFAAIGLAGFYYLRTWVSRWAALMAVGLAGVTSVVVNGVGALTGAMHCEVQIYALWPALAVLRNGQWVTPLAKSLFIPLLLSLALLVSSIRNYASKPDSSRQ